MGNRRSIFRVIDPFLLALGAVALVGIGLLIGVLIEGGDSGPASENLQASEIGNVKDGRELFVGQGCSMCHSFEGRGGTDAPSLDFMKGELTTGEIANMSGMIWNHVPGMKVAFAEEHLPFPEFTGNQMASLIAYLHSGGPPPDVKMGPGSMGGEHMGGGKQGQQQMGSE
jgi:mono/diheme cytochrome c family protein